MMEIREKEEYLHIEIHYLKLFRIFFSWTNLIMNLNYC